MEYDMYGYKYEDTDDIKWIGERSAGPENDDFSDYILNERGGYRRGGRYGTNAAHFNEPEPCHRHHDFGPGFLWGRGYGPAGPPMQQGHLRENDTVSFLLRCGVLKPTLKGVPKVLLHLMEPEYCGVCALRFDNFDGARLHYISKNHNKNMKKWLAQQAKVGSQRPKEMPLRARELYCELCDILITSKPHAESHYAGRPHRAIVEGRKVPKNPFLLQKNMQERVEQLIRREKKSLKPIEKSGASEKAKTIPKNIPPELVCDICKISVTCTEQMTMHLNGRKHLSKEKRHIFNMMEGDASEPKPAETAVTAKDADSEGADALGKGDTNYYEDQFDWGHGSSTWDDDPQ